MAGRKTCREKKMKKRMVLGLTMAVVFAAAFCVTGCAKKEAKTITMVWLPDNVGPKYQKMQDTIGRLVEEATGKKVTHICPTDYAITVESIVKGKAGLAYTGGQAYVEAHHKNPKLLPLVVISGPSGTLQDACYNSWLAVKTEDAENFKTDGKWDLTKIQGKRMSYVSTSSTSGFMIPSSYFLSTFGGSGKWQNLTRDDLMEGGPDKFFSEVLFGGSHHISMANLLSGKSDLSAFCDDMLPYLTVVGGTADKQGAVYQVRDDAAEPFDKYHGKTFVLLQDIPVLNCPIIENTETLSKEDQEKLLALFTSDEVADNSDIFVPKDSTAHGLAEKVGNTRFVAAADSFYDPLRELQGIKE
jgi:phosphonate transport system substrate-binding protein